MKAAEASMKLLLDNPSKETSELIKEAQAEYKGWYHCAIRVWGYKILFSHFTWVHNFPVFNGSIFSFLALPPDLKLHNLLSLAVKDLEIAPAPETAGSSLLVQHQKLIMEHFGHKDTAVLPEDVIQRLLLGVSTFGSSFSI